ncbi:MAG: RecX family transcriptional regulator [Saprospiraceae bacterium]|nr:RecX family transcriptional regulator [Saprospiraceae bacterium]
MPKQKTLTKSEALAKLMKYCAYQDRCHREVRTKLLSLEIYGDELEEIMAQLIQENFLNEERFARSFARGKFRNKGWGRMKIKRELTSRDISDYCIRKGMGEIEDEEYLQKLRTILEKKSVALEEKNLFEKKQKLVNFALRRGFESEHIWKILDELIPRS